jgi:cellulose synthase/poly-beta-1,6-N-acetylglucosamine synthase-like glycosyltransferase
MRAYQATLEAHFRRSGQLTPVQQEQAREVQELTGGSLGEALWSLNLMEPADYMRALSDVVGCPLFTDWLMGSHATPDPTLSHLFEPARLSHLGFFPYVWQDDKTLAAVVTEPCSPAIARAVNEAWPQVAWVELLASEQQVLGLILEAFLEGELRKQGKLSPAQWHEVLSRREAMQAPLASVLHALGYLRSLDYLEVLAQLTGLPVFSRLIGTSLLQIDPTVSQRFDPQAMLKHRFFPLAWVDTRTLMVMVVDPLDLASEREIFAELPGIALMKVLGTLSNVTHLLDYCCQQRFSEQVWLQVQGHLTPEALRQVQVTWKRSGSPLGQILTRLGFLPPMDYLDILSRLTGLPVFSRLLGTQFLQVDTQLMQRFEPELMMQRLFFPLNWLDDRTALVLVQDPHDLFIDATLTEKLPAVEFVKVLGTEDDVTRLIDHFYQEELSRNAVYQLLSRSPEESAARVFTLPQIASAYGLGMVWVWCLLTAMWGTLAFTLAALSLFYCASILFKLALSLAGAVGRSSAIAEPPPSGLDTEAWPIYTVLVPVYNEPDVIPILLNALSKLDYPQEKLDVLLLLEEKDWATIDAAKAANPPRYIRFIYVPDSQPKTKPKACNYGLTFARGDYLTIYDAEDIPDPDQLKKAIHAFRTGAPSLVCVQAALNYFNRGENFLTRMFTLEYSYWFDYMLPGLDAWRLPIPLGGTSNHFRTDRLRELGGWDPFNVTEDADLGIRASQRGYTVGVIHSTTYEEANCRLKNWLRQRSRWIKGYMQTWLVHNRHPWRSLRRLGLKNWLAYQFFIGGTIITFLSNPLLWGVFLYWLVTQTHGLQKLFPTDWILYVALFNLLIGNALAIGLNILAVLGRRYYELLPYTLLNPVYWQLHSIAAYLALWQLFTKPFYWEKTVHGLSKFSVVPTQVGVHPDAPQDP